MAKVIKKKRKFKLFKFIIFLAIIYGIYYLVANFLDINIKNIEINGNNILSEQQVMEIAKIDDYPSFFKTTTFTIRKRLLKNDYIKDVKVKKRFYNKVIIDIDENKILYIDEKVNKIVLDNGKEINNTSVIGYPTLTNTINDKYKKDFQKEISNIKSNILSKISEIKYDPNEFDKGRFLLGMDDGNYVYLTLTKFNYINYYNEVLPQLEGKKGILYLDSGNHFKIME